MWVVIGLTDNSSFAINITSELFLTLHFLAKNSVTPILFLLKSFLFMAQFIIPELLFSTANL